ncbi:hypothetical protein E5Q_03142 [Mixia osmundae IAM 14324]|uniref:Uncharacterized protein n=2 Tax=Mixia osmundae (strain CBS 9802 / IAM 14324 / JCM 22182 / KY 12970) TaxID=764103 RepID=G7E0W5_MIXOS|nr:hypothetical protein E5Q_03142 [Mixia osmundae IAM 14324]
MTVDPRWTLPASTAEALHAYAQQSLPNTASTSVDLEAILDELLPDESAIGQSQALSLKLQARIQAYRQEILERKAALQAQQSQGATIADIQQLVGELLTEVHHLRAGATESEVVVREITRDIKSLDLAKRNVVTTINTVQRFQSLKQAQQKLEELAQTQRYREISQTLQVIAELAVHFNAYKAVTIVSELQQNIRQQQNIVRERAAAELTKAFTQESRTPIRNNTILPDACLATDALGPDARKTLINWYCTHQLKDYRRIFKSNDEAGQLDNLPRRFAWFRRILRTYEDEHASVFPTSWTVGRCLTGCFGEVTRDDLRHVIEKTNSAKHLTVTVLLESLNATKDFEREMCRLFSVGQYSEVASSSTMALGSAPEPISAVFVPFLDVFVKAQDKTLAEMFGGFRSTSRASFGSATPHDANGDPATILPSATELVYFYRDTLERCAKLSNQGPLLSLCLIYRKWLKVYADEILAGSLSSRLSTSRRSGDTRTSSYEIQHACIILNTSAYCSETASQLEDRMKTCIDAGLKEKVTFEAEKDLFIGVISQSLNYIVRELDHAIEPPLSIMAKAPWSTSELVSSESAYTGSLNRAISETIDAAKSHIDSKKYVRSLCDRAIGIVLTKFMQNIIRCRPITHVGAEQLMLDLQSLKRCLLQLPQLSEEQPNASYARLVNKGVGRIDIILKVVMEKEHPPDAFVQNYLILIPCMSFSDFQKILDLKGVRRTDQNSLLDVFLAQTSSKTDLSDSSFLSSLDMDPEASPGPASAGIFGGLGITTSYSLSNSPLLSNPGKSVPSTTGGLRAGLGFSSLFG